MPVQIGAPPQHGFDEPLGLLGDCHRRIEHFLGILRTAARSGGETLSDSHRRAVESALAYFRTAGPRHNQDEENSLFPLMRQSADPRVIAALETIDSLEREHVSATTRHEQVDQIFSGWLASGTVAPEPRRRLVETLDDLHEMYAQHIAVEDSRIFPLAAGTLRPDQLRQLGTEMAERRGLSVQPAAPRKESSAVTAKTTIDVRTIPGPQRHPLIFRTFDGLQTGEALEIVNDHNPIPLHNQFQFNRRGQFEWLYLQDGPELWRVRIARIASPPGDPAK